MVMQPKEGDERGTPCVHISTCEMYSLFERSGTLTVWKINYCFGGFDRCQRYLRSNAGERVPPNLLPNGSLLDMAVEDDSPS